MHESSLIVTRRSVCPKSFVRRLDAEAGTGVAGHLGELSFELSSSMPLPASLTSQRIFSFSAGLGAAALTYISMQRLIWSGTASISSSYGHALVSQRNAEEELFFGPRTRALMVRGWNRAVDSTLGATATELAKRGL